MTTETHAATDFSAASVAKLIDRLDRAENALRDLGGLIEAMQLLTFEFCDTETADPAVQRIRAGIVAVAAAMTRSRDDHMQPA